MPPHQRLPVEICDGESRGGGPVFVADVKMAENSSSEKFSEPVLTSGARLLVDKAERR